MKQLAIFWSMFGWRNIWVAARRYKLFHGRVSFKRLNTSPASLFDGRDALSLSQQSDIRILREALKVLPPRCKMPISLALCGLTAYPIAYQMHLLMLLLLTVWPLSMFWTSNLIDLACLCLDFQMQLKRWLSCTNCVSHPPAPGRTDLESLSRWWPSQEEGRPRNQRFSCFSDAVAFGSWWLPPLQRNIHNWFGSMYFVPRPSLQLCFLVWLMFFQWPGSKRERKGVEFAEKSTHFLRFDTTFGDWRSHAKYPRRCTQPRGFYCR